MGRHAYCIIAHNDDYCLNTLLSLIDDSRNDVFLVFDKKSPLKRHFKPTLNFSKVYLPKSDQLIDIQWGGVSLMRAELLAFSMVVEHGDFDYVHLLSGVDLPLKSQDYIHNFFDNLKPGTNCIDFASDKHTQEIFELNCKYYHLFTNYTRCRNVLKRKVYSFIRKAYIKCQKALKMQRNWDGWTFGKGSEWVSLSFEFVKYLIENKGVVLKQFRGIHVPDEVWKQTMLLSSPFKDTVLKIDGVSGNLRLIDWERGDPYVWRNDDYLQLKDCTNLFARKFSSVLDKSIIENIHDLVIIK